MDFVKRINWLMVLAYFILIGAILPLMIYVTNVLGVWMPGAIMLGVEMTVLFAVLGAFAYAFYRMGEGVGWKWLAYTEGVAAAFCLWIGLIAQRILHPAIGLSALFFIVAGLVMAASSRFKAYQERQQIEGGGFRELGTGDRLGDLSPMERDHAPANRDRGDHSAR